MKWIIYGVCLLLSQAAFAAGADTVRVGQADSAGLETAWSAILKEAGIRYETVSAPNEQKRRWFVRGEIVLDCCAIPEWRDRPVEQRVQLFSDVFYLSEEHFVFPKNKVSHVESPADLLGKTVAIVRGFDYPAEVVNCQVLAGRNVDEMLDLIASGQADVGLISLVDFAYYMHEKPRALTLGEVHRQAGLRIRVHKSRADLLEPINRAIAKLKADGRLQHMMQGEIRTR